MKCYSCNKTIDENDYCVCLRCNKKSCSACAESNSFVCPECGGDMAYLS